MLVCRWEDDTWRHPSTFPRWAGSAYGCPGLPRFTCPVAGQSGQTAGERQVIVMWHERMRDAAYAASIPTSWRGAVAGYVAHGDPYRVWSAADWQRFRGLRKLPVFVRSNPAGREQALQDAANTLRDLRKLGVPKGRYVALDRETSHDVNDAWAWAHAVRRGGYLPIQYRSESTPSAPGFNWDWVAWYRGIGPFMADKPAAATQYASGTDFDSSTVRPWIYIRGHWWR